MDSNDQQKVAGEVAHSYNNSADLGNSVPRENLIGTAIKFLQNPKVISSALAQKRAFLKSKGLTDQEIDIAIQRAGVPADVDSQLTSSAPPPPGATHHGYGLPPPLPPVAVAPVSVWVRLREYLSAAIVMGGAAYVVYYIYKKYLAPYLFGKRKNKLDVLEESITELKRSTEATLQVVRELQQQQQQMSTSWTSRSYSDDSFRTADRQFVEEIKGEIKSLKALMLTPRQFPQAPTTKPVLPEWQLSAAQASVSSSSSRQPASNFVAPVTVTGSQTTGTNSSTMSASSSSASLVAVGELPAVDRPADLPTDVVFKSSVQDNDNRAVGRSEDEDATTRQDTRVTLNSPHELSGQQATAVLEDQ